MATWVFDGDYWEWGLHTNWFYTPNGQITTFSSWGYDNYGWHWTNGQWVFESGSWQYHSPIDIGTWVYDGEFWEWGIHTSVRYASGMWYTVTYTGYDWWGWHWTEGGWVFENGSWQYYAHAHDHGDPGTWHYDGDYYEWGLHTSYYITSEDRWWIRTSYWGSNWYGWHWSMGNWVFENGSWQYHTHSHLPEGHNGWEDCIGQDYS